VGDRRAVLPVKHAVVETVEVLGSNDQENRQQCDANAQHGDCGTDELMRQHGLSRPENYQATAMGRFVEASERNHFSLVFGMAEHWSEDAMPVCKKAGLPR
jgi:hypothetical protein